MGETRMPLLPGVQRSALGGVGALGSRLLLLLFSLAFVLLALSAGAALRSRFSSSADATAAWTPPDLRYVETSAPDLRQGRGRIAETRPVPTRYKCTGCIVDAPGREKDPDAIELARFAVAEHNSKTNAELEFERLVKVRMQVVAGLMYYFTIEVREVDGGGPNKLYEAKVWSKPWNRSRPWEKPEELFGVFEPITNAA